jgi:hypothetical protein
MILRTFRKQVNSVWSWPVSQKANIPVQRMREQANAIVSANTRFPTGRTYSADLKSIVSWCLEYRADDQPSLAQIEDEAARFLAANPLIRDNPMLPSFQPVPDPFTINAHLPAHHRV